MLAIIDQLSLIDPPYLRKELTNCNMYATLSRMKATSTSKAKQGGKNQSEWPKLVQPGRAIVRVYRRKTPSDNWAFMVANYADGEQRRFDSYANEADALAAADTLAKRLDKRDYVAASMTQDQAIEYANSATRLKPFGVTVDAATAGVAEWLGKLGSLANIHAAVKFYHERRRPVTSKPLTDVVTDFLKVKTNRSASDRYMRDLNGRLSRFAGDCVKDCCDVTGAEIQEWLDGLGLSPQSYRNYRTVLHTLFSFAVAKGYAADNPVEATERVKVRNGDVEVFTPVEVARLLEAARVNYPDYLPVLAIGAFAGLRSAEIERLDWSDVDLTARHIVVAASKAKTASRRIVPITDNLAAWLAPYAGREGKIWRYGDDQFFKTQDRVAAATEVKADPENESAAKKPVQWKQNGLRHSYASYRFAQTGDAGRVAGELGNSAAVVHRHYRELVKPADAERWFAVKPESPANVVPMPEASSARV
jgi:integrase